LSDVEDRGDVPDERLWLIFTCCHPDLEPEAQVALTLRRVCSLSTDEIARAFLVPTFMMARRLGRAKAKIRDVRIPHRVPVAEDLPERLAAVMSVIYLVFNEGYAATQSESLVRRGLCTEAIRLGRLLKTLMQQSEAEVDGLLALMLLQDSRRAARVDERGELVLLSDQERSKWDRDEIGEGSDHTRAAIQQGTPGKYVLQAAIAAVHAEALSASATDWPKIVGLYDRLCELYPSPVVALNRAVALAMAKGPEVALPLVEGLRLKLWEYGPFHATHADLLRRLGYLGAALDSYHHARALSGNAVECRFLDRQIGEVRAQMSN